MDILSLPVIPGPPAPGPLYYNAGRGLAEARIPNEPYTTCHAADLLELPNGDLLCCWFAGSREGNADISIVLSRLPAGKTEWEQPRLVSDDATRSEQNPSLFLKSDDELWLIYTAQTARTVELPPHTNLQYTAEIRRRISHDGGRTFGQTQTIFAEPGSFCRQRIQKLHSGRWLFATWQCFNDDTHNGSDITLVHRSDDAGESWQSSEVPHSRGLVHCNLIEMRTGEIAAFFRSRGADHIYRACSRDGGVTFTEPQPTELPNNNSSISALLLQSGALAIAYNACRFGDDRSTARWPRLRAPLAVALSYDGGKTFPCRRILDAGDGYCGRDNAKNNRRLEYPVLMQSRDGALHAAYTWGTRQNIRYLRFTEDWVRGKEQENEGLCYDF